MKPDPRFPDRPDHPDFDLLSKIIIEHDKLSETGTADESGFAKTFQADIRSVSYMANQRALRVEDLLAGTSLREKLIIAWLDAFTAGQAFGEARAATVTVDDTQHRTVGDG